MNFELPERMRRVQTPIIPVVARLIRENPGTISLGQGVVGYGPPPQAMARMEQFLKVADNHKYKPVQGLPELVSAIQTKLSSENGIDSSVERIFVTAGANMAFMNAIMAITDPGDEVILQNPYYFNHEMAVTMLSCRPVLVRTDAQYQLDLRGIEQAITSRTKAVVTVSPNNPTGAVYPEKDLQAISEICHQRGIYHIHDEAYEYFTWDEAKHFSPGSITKSGAYTISIFSLSKAFGFASWRIGYMVVPEHLVEAISKIQDTNVICAPVISQYVAQGAVGEGRSYCRQQIAPILWNREMMREQLRGLAKYGVETPEAGGAFYFLARIQTDLDSMEAARRLIVEHKVAVIPGKAFGMDKGCYLRIAYAALTPENAREAGTRLSAGIIALSH